MANRALVGWLAVTIVATACGSDRIILCSNSDTVDAMGTIGSQQAAILGGASRAEYLALGAAAESTIVQVDFSSSGGSRGTCTGVIIGEGWVLSAAHCFAGAEDSAIALSFGASAMAPKHIVDARLAAVHPRLDLVLLTFAPLTRSAGASLGIATRSPQVGSVAQLAGFGLNESGQLGERRFVVEEVTELTADSILVSGARRSGACSGDSGGPLMVRDMSGAPVVAGILGAGAIDCVETDEYTRVDIAQSWLESYVGPADVGTSCGSLDRIGGCYDGVAVWCEEQVRHSVLCAAPSSCGWDSVTSGFRCVEAALDPCQGVTRWGECQDQSLARCDAGHLRIDSCPECGAICRRLPTTGTVACTIE